MTDSVLTPQPIIKKGLAWHSIVNRKTPVMSSGKHKGRLLEQLSPGKIIISPSYLLSCVFDFPIFSLRFLKRCYFELKSTKFQSPVLRILRPLKIPLERWVGRIVSIITKIRQFHPITALEIQ